MRNVGNTSDLDLPYEPVNPNEDIEAFDKLDPRLREFMRNLPVPFSAKVVLEQQETWGVEEILRQGQEMLKENFPGWSPI